MSVEVSLEELIEYEGRELSPTDWLVIDQDRINGFAETTDDHQYIHVDPERMKDSEYGSTVSHGFLSLSLMAGHPPPDLPIVKERVLSLNYGLDKVRFINPVKVDSRVRYHTKILSIREKAPGRIIVKQQKTLEIEGEEKPALIAEVLAMVVLG